MLTIIIAASAFIGVSALVGGVAFALRGDASSHAEERLALLTDPRKKKAAKAKNEVVLYQDQDNKPNILETIVSRFLNLRKLLEQADIAMAPSKFLMIVIIASGAAGAACLASGIHAGAAPVAAAIVGALPFLFIIIKRKRRLSAFAKQLPEAMELISRALRAGHSLASGISLVASEMTDPIAKEFTRSYEAQNLGIPLEETLEEMSERVPNLDLRFFVTAVILQRQTGGDLAEILDKIGRLIRERFQIWGQIQALTGEGRLSGVVLLGLPPVLALAMWKINPDYLMVLFTDPLGNQMLAAASVLMIVGALVIRKIVNIKV